LNRDSPGTDGRRKPAKQVRTIARDMTELLNEVKDRVPGGAAKQKAAAKKPLGRSRTRQVLRVEFSACGTALILG
jgi:hypothetical protein